MSYTIKDLEAALEDHFDDSPWCPLQEELFWGEGKISIENLGRVFGIEKYGGEGQGEQYWFIFKVEGEDGTVRHFKRDGWYASFNGGCYDGPTIEVKPAEKLVTVYEKV
jgi:hypothetical protein